MLQLKNVSITRGGRKIIDRMSANASNGELVGLLGPNGSGKTTLLQSMAGRLKIASGKMLFRDSVVDTYSREWRHLLSFVPDDGGTIPLLTIEEQLLLQCQLSGINTSDAKARIEYIVGLLEVESYKRYRGDELSAGLRKRLGIGLGIVRDAEIYLFDEPFASLDVGAAATLSAILAGLQNAGKIVFVASHSFPYQKDEFSRIWRLSSDDSATLNRSDPGALDKVVLPWLSVEE